jgi:opacity protein-like surface antigen
MHWQQAKLREITMKKVHMTCVAAVALLIACVARPVSAAELGFYVGFGGNYISNKSDTLQDHIADDIYALFPPEGGLTFDRASGASKVETSEWTYGFLGGWRWRPNIAFELGYVDLGKRKFTSSDVVNYQFYDTSQTPPAALQVPVSLPSGDTIPPSGSIPSTTGLRTDSTGITLAALGIWPISYRFEAYGRAGVMFTSNHITESIGNSFISASGTNSKSSTDFLAGVGVSWSFLSIYQARLEYTRYFDVGDGTYVPQANIDTVSLGITVTF